MPAEKKNTYCPFLWSEAFIDPKGDVFCCCHRKPSVVGNIYEEKLKDIYSNSKMQQLRQKSIDGTLECYEGCTLIDKQKKQKLRKTAAFDYASDLKKLKIEFGELCNINCIMCWQDHKSRTVLDHKKLIENVDIEPFNDVNLQGGEPLAIADVKAYYDYVASKNKNPLIMTNGLLLKDDWVERIVRHSSYIYISLNAATAKTHEVVNKGSKWEVVLRNIKKLTEARDRYKTNLEILGHMTIVLENLKDIALFVENFKSFGVDQIDFGYDKKVPEYLRCNPKLKLLLKKKITKVYEASRNKSSIDFKRLKMLGLIDAGKIHVECASDK
jgi:MoaA/NifB/PqqE/SkfB family radical SAM enzyme